jgi:ATP-binding protein involved in chromosome partitioning
MAQTPSDVSPNLQGIKNIIVVASGKGGVGKSTTAVNLALSLKDQGAKVGLYDADIYGPSIPIMLGLEEGTRPEIVDERTMKPIEAHGIVCHSIGFLVDADQAMAWRGPMVVGAFNQILNDTQWGDLDYLVVDMPPGTGDIQLSLAQSVPVTGAVIVTTPQDVALLDAKRGIEMFRKVGIPILGVVENMGLHICDECGHVDHIFGEGGAVRIAKDYAVDVLGSLPLNKAIRENSDGGVPIVAADAYGKVAEIYRNIAVLVASTVQDLNSSLSTPNISIVDD